MELTKSRFLDFKNIYWGLAGLIAFIPLFVLEEEKYLNIYRFDMEKITVFQSLLTLATYLLILYIIFYSLYLILKKGYRSNNKITNYIINVLLTLSDGINQASAVTKIVMLSFIISLNNMTYTIFGIIWITLFAELGIYHRKRYNKTSFIIIISILFIMLVYSAVDLF